LISSIGYILNFFRTMIVLRAKTQSSWSLRHTQRSIILF